MSKKATDINQASSEYANNIEFTKDSNLSEKGKATVRKWAKEDFANGFSYAINHYKPIDLLEKYSQWLTKHGYMDTDWKDEEPYAIDEFLKELRK